MGLHPFEHRLGPTEAGEHDGDDILLRPERPGHFLADPVLGVGASLECPFGEYQQEVLAGVDDPEELLVELAGAEGLHIQEYIIARPP